MAACRETSRQVGAAPATIGFSSANLFGNALFSRALRNGRLRQQNGFAVRRGPGGLRRARSFCPSAEICPENGLMNVRIKQGKLSEILIETADAGAYTWVAAGIGINVTHAPDGADRRTSIATLRGRRRW